MRCLVPLAPPYTRQLLSAPVEDIRLLSLLDVSVTFEHQCFGYKKGWVMSPRLLDGMMAKQARDKGQAMDERVSLPTYAALPLPYD
jgi:hypothetical protein